MNDGEMEYAKFGKVGLNNQVSLSHIRNSQRAHQWARICMKKHLVVTLIATLYHICKSGQFYLNPTWVIPLRSMGMDIKRVVSIWKIITTPHDIDMEHISNVFLYNHDKLKHDIF